MQNNKVCLTTFIYGVKYQSYIPFLVYSCHKSYPEYDIILFLYDKLDPIIKKQLDLVGKENLVIKENIFTDCPKMSPLKAKCLRWVLWDDSFKLYDYLYVVDIDMLYIKEPLPLHVQHINHMEKLNLSYDNMARIVKRKPWHLAQSAQRIKHAGFAKILEYFLGDYCEYKATGLMFINVSKYFEVINRDVRMSLTKSIYDNSWLKNVMYPNNEVFLYNILKTYDLNPQRMPLQSDSIKSLDFNNFHEEEFRPHHGIHLGIFRGEIVGSNSVLDTDTYHYYIDVFKSSYMKDEVFGRLIELSPDFIKRQFSLLCNYYQLVK